jgi:hypothetical protein
VSRELENATHGARLPIKVKENKKQHTKYKLGCLYGAATRRKRRHLLKYNSDGETKGEAENGGYLCPSPLSVCISLNMKKKCV